MIARRRAPAALIAMAAALALATGCHSAKKPTSVPDALARSADAAALQERYLIGTGDELEIVFFHTPDLNMLVPVRPDGYISLPFAHDVRAAGRTTEQLRVELVNEYARELESPEIAVIVKTFIAQKIHVGGEVDAPGVYPLEGPMTVLDSLLQAGVLTRTAKLEEVLVIRRDVANSSYMVIAVNVNKVIEGSDMTQNIALAPYDAIFVPTSGIADVNTFVNLYLRQNIPFDFGVRLNVF